MALGLGGIVPETGIYSVDGPFWGTEEERCGRSSKVPEQQLRDEKFTLEDNSRKSFDM